MPRIVPWILSFLIAAGSAPGTAAAAVTPKQAEGWKAELATIDSALRAGEWESARATAGHLVARIVDSRPDSDLSGLVSVALLSQAAAEAASGRTDDALWHWSAAQDLNPRLRFARFPAYGEGGSFLEAHRLREPGTPPVGVSPVRIGAGMEPPAVRSGETVAPSWARFEVVVAEDGSVHEPVLVAPGPPAETLDSARALRAARFEPARADGRSVAVYWRPRPPLWEIHQEGFPAGPGTELRGDEDTALAASLAACEDLGGVMEVSTVGLGPGSVDVIRKKARRKGADVLVFESADASAVKAGIYRCGPNWVPPELEATRP